MMDPESELIYKRMTLHRLMIAHPKWKAEQLAREVDMSENCVRKWIQRFEETEKPHFSMYQSQSRAPKTRQRETSSEIKLQIAELRESLSETYHRPAGPKLIRDELLEKSKNSKDFIPRSSRTISKILREMGYITNPRKVERLPLSLTAPMEEWEMDFCEIRLEEGRFEFFLVVDRGTSRVVYIEGCPGYNAQSAIAAVMRLFVLCGLPKRLRMDRDSRFVWSWTSDSFPAPLIRFLRVLGVQEVICPPRKPWKKPYVERCVRELKEEWLDRFSLNTMADCYEALEAFPYYHNSQRRHYGRACNGKTPDEAFPTLPSLPQLPEWVETSNWLSPDHGRVFRRRVTSNGTIRVNKELLYIGKQHHKQQVLVHLDAKNCLLHVSLEGQKLKDFKIEGLSDEPVALQDYFLQLQEEAVSIERYRQAVWQQVADEL